MRTLLSAFLLLLPFACLAQQPQDTIKSGSGNYLLTGADQPGVDPAADSLDCGDVAVYVTVYVSEEGTVRSAQIDQRRTTTAEKALLQHARQEAIKTRFPGGNERERKRLRFCYIRV